MDVEQQGKVDLEPTLNAGSGAVEEEMERLSSVLERINERFGTEFTHADKFIDEMERHMSENEGI